jgi:membrane dipeptidase
MKLLSQPRSSLWMRVVDLHSDLQLDLARPGCSPSEVFSRRHLPEMRSGGIEMRILSTVSPGPDSTASAVRHLAATLAAGCRVATDVKGLQVDAPVFILGLEGAEPYGTDISLVETFHWLGVRVVQPAWMHANHVTGTCGELQPEGLSRFGRQVLHLLDDLGAILDLAHISDQGFTDAIDHYRGPIMCSHTCSRKLHEHPRNITDEQARCLTERGGIVGVCFVNDFLGGPSDGLERCVDHIEHLLEVAGEDHVGLGPDWVDYALDILEPLNSGVARGVDIHSGVPGGLEGPEGLPQLESALRRRGLPAEKVMAGNADRFLRVALSAGE